MRILPVLALPLLLIVLPLLGRGPREHRYVPLQAGSAPAQPTAKSQVKAGLEVVEFAPFGYYEAKCARCHGENGANYGDLLKGKDDEQLHDGIHAMAVGPGQSPLDEPQLQVMVKWHRALLEGKPFVHLAKVERGDKAVLAGEATPDARVILKSGESSFEATRDGLNWKIEAPQDVDLATAELKAEQPEAK